MAETPHAAMEARIESAAFPEPVELYSFSGHEAISQLFRFELEIACPGFELEPGEVIGRSAQLVFSLGGEVVRVIAGLVSQCDDLCETDSGFARYRLELVPQLWLTSLVQLIDIYMDMTIGELIEHKLGSLDLALGRDFVLDLGDDHPIREFVVQYEETDLAFLMRQTEHFGISFRFEQDGGHDNVVFSDGGAAFPRLDGESVPFVSRSDRRGVFSLESRTRMIPKSYIQRDYNYRTPGIDLLTVAEAPRGDAGAVYEYGNHYKTTAEGERFARIRAEERQCDKQIFEGRSGLPVLRHGRRVTIAGHPRGDRQLLITRVEHRGTQPFRGGFTDEASSYENRFWAVEADVAYRPPRTTPKPRIQGLISGRIEASDPSSKYAEVDAEGRYRVRFLFDTAPEGERQASRPVRMMQPHAGPGYGLHFPLRNGVEVLIAFVGGDPDRPIIAGTAPNPLNASPVSADNGKRNVIRTGGANEVNIDDDEGSERIKLTTPYRNTTFQIGAPNAPESGAALTTEGAKSEVARQGITTAGAFQAGFSTLVDLLSSGNVISMAGMPSGLEYLALGTQLVTGTIDIVDGFIARHEAVIAAEEAALAQDAFDKQTRVDEREVECKACEKKVAAVQDQLPPEVKKAFDDYEAAQKAKKVQYDALSAAIEERNGAVDGRRQGTVQSEALVEKQAAVDAAMLAYDYDLYNEQFDKEFYDAPEADSDDATSGAQREKKPRPTTPDAAKAAAEADEKLSAALVSQEKALEKVTVEVDGEQVAVATYLEACVQKCGEELDRLRKSAAEAAQHQGAMMADHDETVRDLKKQKVELEKVRQGTDGTQMILSAATTIIGALSIVAARAQLRAQWRHATELSVKESRPISGLSDLVKTRTKIKKLHIPLVQPQYTHAVGSEASMAVSGGRELTMWSPHVLLMGVGVQKLAKGVGNKLRGLSGTALGFGAVPDTPNIKKGSVTIVGNEVARLLSPTKVDVASRHETIVSGKVVRLMARTRQPWPPPPPPPPPPPAPPTGTTAPPPPPPPQPPLKDVDAVELRLEADPQDTAPAELVNIPETRPPATPPAPPTPPTPPLGGHAALRVNDASNPAAPEPLSSLELMKQKTRVAARSSAKFPDAVVTLQAMAADGTPKAHLKLAETPLAELKTEQVGFSTDGTTARMSAASAAPNFEVSATADQVHAGTPDAGELSIKQGGDTSLTGQKNLILGAATGTMTVTAKKIDFGGAELSGVNLTVKKGPNPALQALNTRLKGARSKSSAAGRRAKDAVDALKPENKTFDDARAEQKSGDTSRDAP